jgi:hypothetical protein
VVEEKFVFHTDLKNVNLILVKNAPKKVSANWKSPRKIGFWAKLFLGVLFTNANRTNQCVLSMN